MPYQGSKRTLAPLILKYFPERVDRLIEPFAGSAAITIATAIKSKANKYWKRFGTSNLVMGKNTITKLELDSTQIMELKIFFMCWQGA
ncbi:DNA adenine methylase [Cryomorpha ignava]|uniref:DNA adenine methylase n=1 Tax=Cryomorpha ignava TaxID=101383 RepID=A0A7K3WS56_9FLAO|nr:DNA adenine methylase [Cryomorpha ignava]